MPDAQYTFLPWIRQGIVSAIPTVDSLNESIRSRSIFPVRVQLNHNNGSTDVNMNLKLYGPGDITGIDRRLVIRTEPRHLTANFETNYFPFIEFSRTDFPWLFTPARANTLGRLRPWIYLVVVKKQDGVTITTNANQPLPVLEIGLPAQPRAELPDLSESWAWAHVQIAGLARDQPSINNTLTNNPQRAISRILSNRKLNPNTSYYACLVPSFQVGRKAGLGEQIAEVDENQLSPAWRHGEQAPERIRLPVYYHWEFQTWEDGDFEYLLDLLQPGVLSSEVGSKEMDISNVGFGMPRLSPNEPGATLKFEGALRIPNQQTDIDLLWPRIARESFQSSLSNMLNSSQISPAGFPENTMILTPPIYGCWHAAQRIIPSNMYPSWIRDLNLDPRYRAAAGLGTLVVQKNQDALMNSAWSQVGEIEKANQLLRQAQLALSVQTPIYSKHFAKLQVDSLLQITGTTHSRILLSDGGSNITVKENISRSVVPNALVSAQFRKITRPKGPIYRQLFKQNEGKANSIIQVANTKIDKPKPDFDSLENMVLIEDIADEIFQVDKVYGKSQSYNLLFTPDNIENSANKPGFVLLKENSAVDGDNRLPNDVKNNPELDSQEARLFREAAVSHQTLMSKYKEEKPLSPPSVLQLNDLQSTLLEELDPAINIPLKVSSKIKFTKTDDSHVKETPDLGSVMAAPEFTQPMYEALKEISPEILIPGIEHIPENTISLLESNPQFIEAYMVGLSHEMARELLWREYPTDQRGTYFRQFWDIRGHVPPPSTEEEIELLKDIPLITNWPKKNHLGENMRQSKDSSSNGQIVIIIRGDLLRRYPNSIIYLNKAVWEICFDEVEDKEVPCKKLARGGGEFEKYPIFRGNLDPNITFLGFDLSVEAARGTTNPDDDPGWFIVFQQQPTELRFGLDAPTGSQFGENTGPIGSWNELTWGHVVESQEAFESLTYFSVDRLNPYILSTNSTSMRPNELNSAHIAKIMTQRPLRKAIHADDMLPV